MLRASIVGSTLCRTHEQTNRNKQRVWMYACMHAQHARQGHVGTQLYYLQFHCSACMKLTNREIATLYLIAGDAGHLHPTPTLHPTGLYTEMLCRTSVGLPVRAYLGVLRTANSHTFQICQLPGGVNFAQHRRPCKWRQWRHLHPHHTISMVASCTLEFQARADIVPIRRCADPGNGLGHGSIRACFMGRVTCIVTISVCCGSSMGVSNAPVRGLTRARQCACCQPRSWLARLSPGQTAPLRVASVPHSRPGAPRASHHGPRPTGQTATRCWHACAGRRGACRAD